MKLYIRQKVFSWRDSFEIKDETGTNKYYAQSEFLSLGHKLHVTDYSGQEVIYIQQKLLTFLPKFNVFIQGREYGYLTKDITFFKQSYSLPNVGIEVEGDFFAHEYVVRQNGRMIMQLSKEWLTWGDTYVLDIPDEDNELIGLAIMLAIDCERCSAERSNR